MHVVICDDEKAFVEQIQALTVKYLKEIEIDAKIDTYLSGEDFLKSGKLKEYSLVFLDVKMKGIDGVETARRFRAVNHTAKLVFISGLIEYAIYGYEVDALRYIVKNNLNRDFEKCMKAILEQKTDYIEIHSNAQDIRLSPSEIIYFESRGRIIIAHTQNEDYPFYEKMARLTLSLHNKDFVRIHQSFLVNLRYVSDIKNHFVYIYDLKGHHLKKLPVSRSRYTDAKQKMTLYKGRF